MMFQVTVGLDTHINRPALVAALAGMRCKAAKSVTLYIAVPDDNFSQFGEVRLTHDAGAEGWPTAIGRIMLVCIPLRALSAAEATVPVPWSPSRSDAANHAIRHHPLRHALLTDALIHALVDNRYGSLTAGDLHSITHRGINFQRGTHPTWLPIVDLTVAASDTGQLETFTFWRKKDKSIVFTCKPY